MLALRGLAAIEVTNVVRLSFLFGRKMWIIGIGNRLSALSRNVEVRETSPLMTQVNAYRFGRFRKAC